MRQRDADGDSAGFRGASHSTIRERLPEYVTLIARGKAPQPLFPDIASHLESCVECREELEELLHLLVPAYMGQVAPAPSYPPIDLTFLRHQATPVPEKRWSVNRLGRLVMQFSQAVLDAFKPPSLAGAMRGQLLYSYTQEPEPPLNLGVAIEISRDDENPKMACVSVAVDDPNRSPFEQAGNRIVLRADGKEWQGETDETGSFEVPGIPLALLPQLQVEVAPPGDGQE
ncbi:MAG TPA: hypothetical protein VF707_03055 [Ardenticatenaceae bacterium]|jgi:hypothetical protein